MKYIIMADGKGKRWNNFMNVTKHMIVIDGETILERTVKLLNKYSSNSSVIITSHNPNYEIEGAMRHEPENNILEIDRFTSELIEDDICFLYGDTYYSEDAIKTIINYKVDDLMFFGNENSIVAIKIKNSELFRYHVDNVRNLFLENKIKNCKGWQVYQSFQKLEFDKKCIADKYILLADNTKDFNVPADYLSSN